MSTENTWTDFNLDDVVVRVFGHVGILTGRLYTLLRNCHRHRDSLEFDGQAD
jgi:hypothetical protein